MNLIITTLIESNFTTFSTIFSFFIFYCLYDIKAYERMTTRNSKIISIAIPICCLCSAIIDTIMMFTNSIPLQTILLGLLLGNINFIVVVVLEFLIIFNKNFYNNVANSKWKYVINVYFVLNCILYVSQFVMIFFRK